MDSRTPGRLASLFRSWYGNGIARGFSVTLELAHRCNVRCVFCTRWDDPENLRLDTIREISRDMADLGTSYVSLSGGDPLVRPDFPEIVRIFVERSIPVHINTNGVLLRKYAPFLKSVAGSLAGITVSIDSRDPDTHDRIRGMPGTFRRALEGMEALRGAVPLSLACTLNEMNLKEIGEYARFAEELGFEYRFQPVHDDGDNKLSPHVSGVAVEPDDLDGLTTSLEETLGPEAGFVKRQYYRLFTPFFRNRQAMKDLRCVAAARLIYFVDPSGNVFPCDTRRDKPLGNVYRKRFTEIVKGKAATEWRDTCRRGKHGCACMYACIAPNNVRYQDFPLIPLTKRGWPLRRKWSQRMESLFRTAPVPNRQVVRETNDLPFVSIVVANFNGGEFLLRSLRAFLDLDYPPDRREVLLVDDASTDGSIRNARETFSREMASGSLNIVENPENRGVAGAYNRGIRESDRKAEFILKVDNDLLPRRDALRALLRQARSHPEAGIFGGQIFLYDDPHRIHYLGGNLNLLPTGSFRFRTPPGLLEGGEGMEPRALDVVNGCMILVRREVFEQVGLFPEFYGRYEFEDYDFAFGARKMGFASLYCPQAVGHHRVSLASGSEELSRFRLKQRARNGVIFMYRFAPRPWFPLFLAYHLVKVPFDAVRKDHPPSLLLSGYMEGLRVARRGTFPYPVLSPPGSEPEPTPGI